MLDILIWLAIGAFVGWAASKLFKGKKGKMGLLGYIIVGIVGSILGGFLFGLIGIDFNGLIGSIITAIIGAMILLFILSKIKK
jgi:uncharacterized membrane protein YeaQ/YmgE (transglycosylase-associated protein family)